MKPGGECQQSMYVKFIDLEPDKKLKKEFDKAYNEVMQSGIFLNGEQTRLFEQEWAEYNHKKYCILCGCGYDALMLSIRSLSPTHYVYAPDDTYEIIYNSVKSCGFEVTHDENKTKVGICVHLYGQLNPLPKCNYIIEDCSQAHGLKGIGKGIISVWSFYPTKNLGAFGDAGGITTDNKMLAFSFEELKKYRYLNSRIDEIQAAFLRVKLKYLDYWNSLREEIALQYLDKIDNELIKLPDKNIPSVWHQFVIETNDRNRLEKYLWDNEIETMIHYPTMLKLVLSLPIRPNLTQKEIDHVITCINLYKE